MCKHFDGLEARVGVLHDKFVRDQIVAEKGDPASFQADTDRLAAFRLLVHAEFEEFLEAKAREGIDKLDGDFTTGKNIRSSFISMFAFGAILARSDDNLRKFEIDNLPEYFKRVIAAARNYVSDNNGIKQGSFTHLALFSGKMLDEVDTALGLSLNNYGRDRGDVAHKSASRVRTIRAPSAEAKEADDLVKGLAAFYLL